MPARVPKDIDARRLVGVHAEHVSNVASRDFPGHYPGEDNSWDLARFEQVSYVMIILPSPNSSRLNIIA